MASDSGVSAPGRPGAGELLKAELTAEAGRRARQRDLSPLTRLAPFVRAHWGDAGLATLFLLISTGATLGMSTAVRFLVDKGFASHDPKILGQYFIGAAAVVAVLASATALRFFFITKLGERVVADLRIALYRHVTGLDQAYFLKVRTGEVLSRMTTDLTIVENMVGSSISIALRNLLTFIGALGWLLVTHPSYTGLVIGQGALVLIPLFLMGRRVRRLSSSAQERFADAVAYAGETIDALDTVQAFGRQGRAAQRFATSVELAFQTSVKRIGARAMMTALVMILIAGGIGFVLWRAALSMSPGELLQFVILSVMAAGAVGALGETWGDVQKTAGAMERIGELMDARPQIAAPANPRPLPSPALGEIGFHDVRFAYPGRPDLPALNGFNLAVKRGERVALVGPSGAGKSTVFRLLLRFYDPQTGSVTMDGVNLRDADPDEVRARIALVSQDAALFSGSATENLRFGREEATDAELVAAAEAAEADGFIEALPEGFDTPLGERGKTLSGGQRQRLAIARALVRDAPILLLDEATSALDAENERLVQKALDDAMDGRTTLVIAHRLATVLKADRIIVMDEGRVVEQGTHTDLVAKGGLYARLAQLQFGQQAA